MNKERYIRRLKVCTKDKKVISDNIFERNKFVYEQVKGWIENADNKVGISCALFFGAFTVITFLSETCVIAPEQPINKCFELIHNHFFALSIILAFFALCYYAKAIIPNLTSNEKNICLKKYPIFYGDIASLSQEDYMKKMQNGNDSDFNDEIILEIHINSIICLKKMNNYKKGVWLSLLSLLSSAISLWSHFAMYQ